MRIILSVLLLFLFLSIPVRGQNLKLPIANYTSKAYGRDHEPTNYCIITDHRNLVYAGNANGIMEYDGSEWRFIPVREGAYVTSVNLSPQGGIFVGSQQEFGFLVADQTGSLVYRSLSDLLPMEDRFFSTIWSVHTTKNRVFYQAEECLFVKRYQEKDIHAIYPETSFHTSFLVDSLLYIRQRGRGLMVLRGESLLPVPGGSLFTDLGIFGMYSCDSEGRILIVTQEKGLYQYDPNKGIEPMPTGNDEFLIHSGIFGGTALSDGNIALHTMHEGVLIISPDGILQAVINKNAGLSDDDVKDIWQDRHMNIWCALSKGISKIDYSSPVSFYDENAGLEGSVSAIIRHEGRLYAATTSGLFMETIPDALNQSLEFIPAFSIRDQVWTLKSVGSSLLIGTSNGLFEIRHGSLRKISDMNVFTMLWLEEEKLMLAGGVGGLAAFRQDSNWKRADVFADIPEDIKSIAVNRLTRYNAVELWLGTSLQGTVKVLLYPDLTYETSRYYGMEDGLPEGWVLPFSFQDSVIFGTPSGIMQFVDEQLIRKVLPDSLRDLPEYYRGYFEGSFLYDRIVSDPLSFVTYADGRIWAVIANEITLVHHSTRDMIEKPFRGIDLGEINFIYPDDENTVWFCASEGVARFDISHMDKPIGNFQAAIRSVTITGDSMIFNGYYRLPGFYPPDDPGVLFQQPGDNIPVLDYANNDLTFLFTSPFYDNEDKNEFSWRLEGSKSGWSAWSGRRVTTFTNLHEGEYSFLIRIKNIYGDTSEPTGYSFIIRPPWYRTALAYILYAALLGIFVYAAVRLGQRRLRKKNERLEAIVQERTEEIRKQNIELAAQKKEITDSIYYAERIQRAILPRTERIAEKIEGYFILFKPKDIVSGDFYWLAENKNKIIITAVDCTGHGVPGAFMSMLGVSFLNKIILENNTLQADRILNDLRYNVVSSLKQTGKEGEARDGMDMALVVIDLEEMSMEFAGANNPLYMIRENELNETKADRMPIAFHVNSEDFSNHKIPLVRGDTFFLFSDGYADQFGGPKGKKYMYKPFKRLLIENKDKPMDEIRRILDHEIEGWKAPQGPDGDVYEQVDDILVIGLRI
jgi:serine phosphatase RsbU (regulator of sigma subunit)